MSYIPKYPDVKAAIKQITTVKMSIEQKLTHIKSTEKSEIACAIKALLNKDKK